MASSSGSETLRPIKDQNLCLDPAEEAEESNARRFLRLPSGDLLAYGGEHGTVSCMRAQDVGQLDGRFEVVHHYDDPVTAMAVSENGKNVAIGFQTGTTQIYEFDYYKPSMKTHPYVTLEKVTQKNKDDLLLSQEYDLDDCKPYFMGPCCEGSIRDLIFLPSHHGYFLGVAAEDGMFVIDACDEECMEDSGRILEMKAMEAHDHSGIRSLAVATMKEKTFLASLAMDGRLCLWDFEEGKLLLREDNKCVPKPDYGITQPDAFDPSCRPILRLQGNGLLIGTPGTLKPNFRSWNFGKGTSALESTFEANDKFSHVESIVAMAFCSENVLITTGRDCKVGIWIHSASTNRWIQHETGCTMSSASTDLYVHKCKTTKRTLVFVAGSTGKYDVMDVSSYVDGTSTDSSPTKESNKTAPKILKKGRFTDHGDDDDDDESVQFSPSTKKNVHFLEEAEEDDDAEDKTESELAVTPRNNDLAMTEDSEDDAESLNSAEDTNLAWLSDSSKPTKWRDTPRPQPAFSPSSTPLDLTRRFLCWNHMGSVTLLQGENNRNTIDIHFADAAFKRPISFTDNMNFIIGSIGESGGIFASDIKEDDDEDDDFDEEELDGFQMSERTKQAVRRDRKKRGKQSENAKPTGSSIFFYRFLNSSLLNRRNKDWHLVLPDGERVLGAACGDGWAAAMTSRQFLRFFSPGGNQNHMIWLRGEPVTMVGRGRFLAVFYHESAPLMDRTQQLEYTLWDAVDFRMISKGSVSCLSRGSSLSWVGFSNDLSLMVMDTDGMLSMLIMTGQDSSSGSNWEWSPVLDTVGLRKSADDRHWPVTVHDGKMVCIPLKGGNTYPDATRRPVTSTLGLRMPLAKSVLAKNSALEELSVRSNIALSQKKFVNDCESRSQDPNELEDEYVALSAQVDKVTLRLFSAMVDAGKLESAYDLIHRLHSEKSYDIAIRISDRQYKLADEIEKAKNLKFAEDDEDGYSMDGSQVSNGLSTAVDDRRSQQISPDSSRIPKRSFERPQHVGADHKKSRFN